VTNSPGSTGEPSLRAGAEVEASTGSRPGHRKAELTHHGSCSALLTHPERGSSQPRRHGYQLYAFTRKRRSHSQRAQAPKHWGLTKYGSSSRKLNRKTVVKGTKKEEISFLKQWAGGERDFGLVEGWTYRLLSGFKGGAFLFLLPFAPGLLGFRD
jgi:hypothetical protein